LRFWCYTMLEIIAMSMSMLIIVTTLLIMSSSEVTHQFQDELSTSRESTSWADTEIQSAASTDSKTKQSPAARSYNTNTQLRYIYCSTSTTKYTVVQIKIPHRTKYNFSTTVWDFYAQISWFIWETLLQFWNFLINYFTFLQSYGYINILCHIFNFGTE